MEKTQSNLRLIRFCGEELYPIESATWHFHKSEEDNINELWLEIKADYGQQLSEDTKYLEKQPHWELTIKIENLKLTDFVSGFKTEIESGFDEESEDYLTNFYYCEHEPSDNNSIEIVERNENQILFRIEGEITDVNYYDGSKPNNKIIVETWFENGLTLT
ncbi:hypothetical protein G1K66_12590 [Tenacibaculum finnmarkense]|uniref:hypothetical protein n=1 Tax=Tenacibaculum finnmarkense TaxID=2781243 RepID=UPI00187B8370|nr:hypothetical protein [Tenacibaculum finnmarkense]MBE7649170.1 hypothetical protein [Tenacibaculum finnmarkense genomovar ulcerans]MCD8401253.1 hypothetical protein [Tenacibaculum finnmarkense genomovar ulcerans]MCG8237391.1 hypothetical protein [Tenacibaculum finnmarkense genomovar ulcerans]MCG8763556.1 hypothetical protein [Tenacibaculum finnmarkense]MCG8786389.1 hypothetical protein [Tenacibaculum finnmarkense]